MAKLQEGFKGERYIYLPANIVSIMQKHPLLSDLYITHIGFFPEAKYHYRERPEGGEQNIFIYCVKGEGWYEVNGNSFKIRENEFFILPQHVRHRYGSSESTPWTLYWVHFTGSKAHFFAQGFERPTSMDIAINSRITDRITIFEEMLITLEKGYELDRLIYAATCLYYFLGSIRFYYLYNTGAGQEQRSQRLIIKNAIHFMTENVEKRIKLQDIASYVNLSPAYFSNYFSRITGVSPITYFNNLKIQYTCKLLETTDMKVNQICYKAGFNDPYYYTRLFTKVMGISPIEYKLNHSCLRKKEDWSK